MSLSVEVSLSLCTWLIALALALALNVLIRFLTDEEVIMYGCMTYQLYNSYAVATNALPACY